jgi:hypothetical protein
VARPPQDWPATHPISSAGDIYIYIIFFFLAGNAPHLAGRQYIIFFFSCRPRTPSRRPAIYNFFFLSPATHPISPAIFFSLPGKFFFFGSYVSPTQPHSLQLRSSGICFVSEDGAIEPGVCFRRISLSLSHPKSLLSLSTLSLRLNERKKEKSQQFFLLL